MPVVDPNGNTIDQNNPMYVTLVGAASGGATPVDIPAGKTTATVVAAVPGTLYGVTITTIGAGSPTVFDNASAASGLILAVLPASAPIGLSPEIPSVGATCVNGVTISGGATNPAMTVFFHI
jgi:hypothetical protein